MKGEIVDARKCIFSGKGENSMLFEDCFFSKTLRDVSGTVVNPPLEVGGTLPAMVGVRGGLGISLVRRGPSATARER